MDSGIGNEQAEGSTHETEENRFGEKLPPEAGPVGAQSQARRQLPHADVGSGQHQIGDVHTPDE